MEAALVEHSKQHKIVSDQTTLDVDDSYELTVGGDPIPIRLSVWERDGVDTEAEIVEDEGRNLSSNEKALIGETWAAVGGTPTRYGGAGAPNAQSRRESEARRQER